MSTGTVAVIIVVAVIAVALIIAVRLTSRRRRLRQRFGPEYDRVVSEQDSRLRAEAELTERQRRVRKFDIQPLTDASRAGYLARWQLIQEQFVDAPDAAVTGAHALVTTVMKERGYPATDDDQAMADLSVDHASTVGHFRSAQEIAGNVEHGSVSTEDLRQALIHYRELFADLLGDPAEVTAARMTGRRPAATSETIAAAEPAAIDDNPDGNPDGRPVTAPDLDPGSASWHQER
jgi:hypothetical protein